MNNKKQYINFLLTFDNNYIIQAGITAYSIASNLNKNYIARFFLFTTDVKDENLENFKQIQNSEFINIDIKQYLYLFDNIDINNFANKYINLSGNYRLLMFKILPEYVDKICYVDCDIIVDTDISVIYNNFNCLAKVVVESLAMQNKNIILKHCYSNTYFTNFVSDSNKFPYFNSGFLLINLEKAKNKKLFDQCFEFLKQYPASPYSDQDTLNAVIGQQYIDEIEYLEPDWNVFCDFDYDYIFDNSFYNKHLIKRSLLDPKILHFGGINKPWKNHIANYYLKWWNYFFKSPFKDEQNFNLKYKEIIKNKNTKTIKLFNQIPLLQIRKRQNDCIYYKLFGIIPLLKIRFGINKTKYIKLFNVIPLLKIN